jgi:CheY-like chemotaxis protein
LNEEKYILIAEDDEDDQFLLRLAFKEVSIESNLVFVENGIDLLNHFKLIEEGVNAHLPSLLIVDLNMPKKNGREAIKELSQNKEIYNQFPTIIFSTTGNEIERSRCEELGINNFFVKPSDYNQLIKLVRHFKEIETSYQEKE